MLLPKLLEPADHATAANLLIAHLAEATRLGPAAEALIRLPVLATLGLLNVDAGTAKKLLTAVLNVSCLQTKCCLPQQSRLHFKKRYELIMHRPGMGLSLLLQQM